MAEKRSTGKDPLPTSNPAPSHEWISREAAIQIMREYNLLISEITMMLEEKLIAVYLMKKRSETTPPDKNDFRDMLKLAVRILKPKQNRNIKEAAILAYAENKLMQLGE